MKSKERESSLISVFLLLTLAITLVALPAATAHTPAWQIPTYAYITVSPNPIGTGQSAAIIYWLDIPPPTAGGSGGDRWRNISIDVAKPDGSKQTLGPFISDPVGSGGALFVPEQTGTYTFTVKFPGQTLSLFGPTGIVGTPSDYVNDTYLPRSATATLTVKQDSNTGTSDLSSAYGLLDKTDRGTEYCLG